MGILEFFSLIPAFLGGISRENSHRGIHVWDRGPTSLAYIPGQPMLEGYRLDAILQGKTLSNFLPKKIALKF